MNIIEKNNSYNDDDIIKFKKRLKSNERKRTHCIKKNNTIKNYGKIEHNIHNNNTIRYNNNVIEVTKRKNNNLNNSNLKKYKKKHIPSTLRRLVWHTYIGEEIGKAKCYCCKLTDITQLSFHCGHVVAERQGGKTILSNLRPVCQNCNSSMNTRQMYSFMKLFR